MVHRCQSLIKGDKWWCGPKCFRDERRVVEESTLLTTAVQPQPVRTILCCSPVLDRLAAGTAHTTEEYCTCVKIRSEFKGRCVICGTKVNWPPLCKKNIVVTDRKTLKLKKKTQVSNADGLHECESRNTSQWFINPFATKFYFSIKVLKLFSFCTTMSISSGHFDLFYKKKLTLMGKYTGPV